MDDGWEIIETARLKELEKLLNLAKCPNDDCDQMGTCAKQVPGWDGEPDIDTWECQFCTERAEVLKKER